MDKNQLNTLMRFAHGTVTKEAAIGFFIGLILDKDLFKLNQNVSAFSEDVFRIHFLPYAVRSRTLMCAKICRHLIDKDQKELAHYGASTRVYFEKVLREKYQNQITKKNNTALSNMELWVSGILKKDK
ncbi:hypothetical protein ACONXG_000577 [Yersinia enterocolitica]|nr:hypothetical protein [Yersinia enterocolitica]EKN5118391.1 hypothetical protein [Yersinia enterocolitica]